MKIGTLRCSLFGHKFVRTVWDVHQHIKEQIRLGIISYISDHDKFYQQEVTNYCIRCGIDKK